MSTTRDERRRLPRVLGLFDVSVLASAAMGPAYSLASTMGLMVAAAGSAVVVSVIGLVALMSCIAVAFARLSRVAPNAGSSYSWVAQAFGPRAGGYAAWLLLLSNYFATMSTALPAAVYTLDLIAPRYATSPLWDALVGTLWIVASTALLFVGARPTALVSAVFLFGELAVLLASAVAAALHPAAPLPAAPLPAAPLAPSSAVSGIAPSLGATGIITAMVLGIWMIDGWEVSASASEEARGSADTPGRGGLVGLLVTSAVLVVAMLAYLHVGTPQGFADNQADAMGYVATRLGGGAWTLVIDATVLVSTAATLWTTILYLSRSVFAMGRDGVLPRAIGELDARSIPRNSLVVVFIGVTIFTLATGVWPSAAAVLAAVVNGTAVFLGLLFVCSALAAVATLRARGGGSFFIDACVPIVGATGLLAIVAIDVATSDPTTRSIELAGVALGIPFALARGRNVASVPSLRT